MVDWERWLHFQRMYEAAEHELFEAENGRVSALPYVPKTYKADHPLYVAELDD